MEAAKSKEGGRTSELTSERSGIERGSIMREPGSKNSHRKMESNRTLLKVTYEKTTKPREDGKTQCLEDNSNRDNAANKVTIDKEKLRRMLESDDERSSSSYEGRADIELKKSKTHKPGSRIHASLACRLRATSQAPRQKMPIFLVDLVFLKVKILQILHR